MPKRTGLMLLTAIAVAAALTTWAYRSDMRRIRADLAEESQRIDTPFGTVEYTRWGDGPPALFIHGAGGGWDQGRLIAGHFIGDGYAWIAVSRFGYLGAPLPEDASTAAQADALAALLDHLDIDEAAILGVSGGAPPAIQLAARHPERVSALVLLTAAPFTPLTAESQDLPLPAWAYQALFATDFPYWALTEIAPSRFGPIFDARPELTADLGPEDAAFLAAMIRAFLPVTDRLAGTASEGAAIDPAATYPTASVTAPTLLVHARDDGINPFPIAEYAAGTIPGARLVALDSGGHMMLGQTEKVRAAVRSFLAEAIPH